MTIPITFGLIGLVVDVGWCYWRKEACLTAAQSAASAAATNANSSSTYAVQANTVCPATLSASVPLQAGCLYATQNGFTNGSNRRTVSMAAGTSGSPAPGVSPSYWVTATVSEVIPTKFLGVLGQSLATVNASATAGVFASGGGCIYVLDPSAAGALSMTGTTNLTSGCGVYVNSNAIGALSRVGSSVITTTGGAVTAVVGTVSATGSGSINPAAQTGVTAHSPADPFAASLPAAPATGSCQPTAQFTGGTAHTIPAGTYCDQITQTGSATLTLTSGTYVLQAGIKMTGTAALTATGPVTLYVSGGGIDLAGSGGINLSPPTSGSYAGIAIWQPSSNNAAGTIVGSTTQVVSGLIYMPSAALSYTGTSATSAVTSIVVDTLSMVGTSSISSAPSTPWANVGLSGIYLIQ